MGTRHSIVVASILALALAAGLVLAASARATFPGRNGLIAFTARVAGPEQRFGTEQIFVMNPDGSGQKQITHGTSFDASGPSISPDGSIIVFAQWTGNTDEIRAMSTTGADSRHLATAEAKSVCFSPDGRQVAFTCKHQVWVMNADGSHQRRLTALTGLREAWIATYSPNGKTIVIGATDAANKMGPCEILAVNADGSHLRRLASTAEPGSYPWPARGLSFSPDGKKIAYCVYANKTETETLIRVMNADGTNQRLLPHSYGFTEPCYSPDGRQILCLNGHHQISVARVNGTHWRQLTHVSGGVGWPNWGPHVR
jgi:Tol biopolymer transport system component